MYSVIGGIAVDSYLSIIILILFEQNNCGQIGTGTTTNQPTPRKISAAFGGKKVNRNVSFKLSIS